MHRFKITQHAVDRYIERIADVTQAEARRRLAGYKKIVLEAAAFGCRSVKLGCGGHLALDGAHIVTVYAPAARPRAIRRDWRRPE